MSATPEDNGQQHRDRYPPSRIRGLLPAWKPGQSPNPGGLPKRKERVDVAYQKLLNMSEEELTSFVPTTGAEILAMEQFKRACNPQAKNTLAYAQEVTNRTDGVLVRKLEKTDVSALVAERERFELAVGVIMDRQGCARADAVLALATVNPVYRKFLDEESGE